MSGPGSTPDRTPTGLSMGAQIDLTCDHFEKAWRAGERPRIEDYLDLPEESDRERLLGELLQTELQLRQQAGEILRIDEYHGRFPAQQHLIDAVFGKAVQPRRLGDYDLLEELGGGGMGVVYRARQVLLGHTVALKLLRQRCLEDPQAVARFLQEMQTVGRLDHPNVVRAYNAGQSGGRHFLAMEFVDGVTLQQLVARRGPLSIGAACELIRQAALGLQHAHEHGLVHRDVKPANLMLSRSGTVKLLDLGLARLLVGTGRGRSLTDDGVAVGTIDYMAPEQWDNAKTVDIRADIYSLGCTLFYLLTGQPPYGGREYESTLKKLAAHATAPVPALPQWRSDCPPQLEHVFRRMMAKTASKRFGSPAEVANAAAPFAEAAGLGGLIEPGPAGTQSQQSSVVGLRGSQADTLECGSGRRRRRRLKLTAMVATLLLLVLAVTATVWRPWRPKPEPVSVPQQVRELVLLPGLNGQWWFDEMPWYLPFVRQAMAEAVQAAADPTALLGSTPARYLDPNTAEVQQWLWGLVGRSRQPLSESQKQLLGELRALADASLDDKQLYEPLRASCQRFAAGRGETAWSAPDLHTQALLLHKLAAIQKDPALKQAAAEQAKQGYLQALEQYARANGAAAELRALCLADYARLCAEVLGDFDQASRQFEEALAAGGADLFRVETLAAYGAEAAALAKNADQYKDFLFHDARKALAASAAGERSHPLAAHIRERHAWSLMDQWKVEQAAREFHDALDIRETNQREGNPFAAIYVWHNRHGLAMTLRYRGDLAGARGKYEEVVKEIDAALAEAEPQTGRLGQQRFWRDLCERAANSRERWSDCELYGGAASGAALDLAKARQRYQQARKDTNDPGTQIVMACKDAILAALDGQPEEARQVLDSVDAALDGTEAHRKEILGPDRERAALLRQVAQAVWQLKKPGGPADGPKALRDFLDGFRLSRTNSRRRETLELRLLCAELLLSSDLEANDAATAQKDLTAYLDPLFEVFRGREDMRPYLRRCYDLAIRACERADLVRVAQYILDSRATERRDSPGTAQPTLLVFYFTARENSEAAESFALFLPPGKTAARIPLALTRQQIRQAASAGQRLVLDEKLVKLVQDELGAGRAVEPFWSDEPCWPKQDERALRPSDWQPFAEQLDLPELRTKQ